MAVERKRLPIPVHENSAFGVREAEKEGLVHGIGPSGVRDGTCDETDAELSSTTEDP